MVKDIETEIYRMFIGMAERRQDFLVDSQFLMQELVRKGYAGPFDQIQSAADRIYTKLEEHPEIQAQPLHNGLGPRL